MTNELNHMYGIKGPSQNHILHSHTVETPFHVLQFKIFFHLVVKVIPVPNFPHFHPFP